MAAIVEISAVETTVHCDEKGHAEQKITVHNISGREVRLGARVLVDSPGKNEWMGPVVPSGKKERKETEWVLDENDTIQLTVPIKAEDAPEGQYSFRVEVFSTDAPGEDYVMGNTLAFKVPARKAEPVKEVKKKFPMWIIAVIGCVLVVGGGISALLMMDGGDDVEVPNLIGLSYDEAKATLKYNNLRYGSGVINPGGGIVTFQDPKAHTKVEKNSKVQIVVEVVKGFKVTRVRGSGGQLFVQVDGRVWHELRADGRKAFDFRETRRDEWSVYLVDKSRGVNIQIDLHRKEIIYSDSRGKKFVLAKVLESFK